MEGETLNKQQTDNSDLGAVSGGFYGKVGAAKLTVRRASDNALLTVDLSTEKGKQEAKLFCKGTDG